MAFAAPALAQMGAPPVVQEGIVQGEVAPGGTQAAAGAAQGALPATRSLAPPSTPDPAVGAAVFGPVVVELFTSQGCPYCPPADALLAELARRPEVLPLALHVDYWDYIGWPDRFADPAFTRRQKSYARASGQRNLFTPQMVVDGTDHVTGYRPLEVAQLIEAHAAAADAVAVQLTRAGDVLHAVLRPASAKPGEALAVALADLGAELGAERTDRRANLAAGAAPMALASPGQALSPPSSAEVYLVRFRPAETVTITHGENAGRTVSYVNIVTDWQQIGPWDGRTALELALPLSGDEAAALIVQSPDAGPILGAGVLR